MQVLAIGAQPGEIEFRCGGTLARFVQRGDNVSMICISNGNLSDPAIPSTELADIRYEESKQAAEVLGVELYWLGNSDFAIEEDPVTTMKLLEIIRDVRPEVLITHSAADCRIDHASTHTLALRAAALLAGAENDPALYQGDRRIPVYEMDTLFGIGFEPLEYVDISQVVDTKHAAIECHTTHLEVLTRIFQRDLLQEFRTVGRYRGLQTGVGYAEAFSWVPRAGHLRAERLLP